MIQTNDDNQLGQKYSSQMMRGRARVPDGDGNYPTKAAARAETVAQIGDGAEMLFSFKMMENAEGKGLIPVVDGAIFVGHSEKAQ